MSRSFDRARFERKSFHKKLLSRLFPLSDDTFLVQGNSCSLARGDAGSDSGFEKSDFARHDFASTRRSHIRLCRCKRRQSMLLIDSERENRERNSLRAHLKRRDCPLPPHSRPFPSLRSCFPPRQSILSAIHFSPSVRRKRRTLLYSASDSIPV